MLVQLVSRAGARLCFVLCDGQIVEDPVELEAWGFTLTVPP